MHTDSLIRFGRFLVVRRMLALAAVTGLATAIAGACPGVASASTAPHGQLRAGSHVAPGSRMTLAQAPAGLRAAVHKTLGIHAGPAAWSAQAELTASDGSGGAGDAYVYQHSTAGWSQTGTLTSGSTTRVGQFGLSVAISGSTAVAGADYTNSATGAAFVFVNA